MHYRREDPRERVEIQNAINNNKKKKKKIKGRSIWRDLQSMDPSEGDVDGGNDDAIGINVEPGKRSEHHTDGHVELVVPRRSHVHHRRVGVPLLRCFSIRRRSRSTGGY